MKCIVITIQSHSGKEYATTIQTLDSPWGIPSKTGELLFTTENLVYVASGVGQLPYFEDVKNVFDKDFISNFKN